MPANYTLLEKITVGAAGASSVTFSGIPQTGYTDLVIKASIRGTDANTFVNSRVSFNGSTSGYTSKLLYGNGSYALSADNAVTSAVDYSSYGTGSTATASTFGNTEIYIPNYTGSTNKSLSVDAVTENNATLALTTFTAGLWSNTAAITSITITPAVGTYAANSTFYLYGVAKLGTTPAIVPYATGGDTIMTDGTYWYHAFRSSGTFTPQKGLTADILCIAGGGGTAGTTQSYGGGGAGGLVYTASKSVGTGSYTVTVGAGGAVGSNGADSSMSGLSLTTAVGGGKGGLRGGTGFSGGSGGGGGNNYAGGAGTSGQGYAGGSGGPGLEGGGGGGGAGGVGGNIRGDYQGGNGGVGSSAYSSWGSVTGTGQNSGGTFYFAGGGGAYADGAAGLGGGGAYANNGTANTGGGGGGSSGSGTSGGSGIVIVRYAV